MIKFILGLFVGAFIGVSIMAVMQINKEVKDE